MRTTALFTAMAAIILVTVTGTAAAGAADAADDQKMLARAQRLLRQTATERDTALTENAGLKSEVGELNRKLGALKKSSEASLARSRESNAALSEDRRKTMQNLRQVEADKTQLQSTVVEQAQWIESCGAKNVKLVEVNRELLQRYKNKGVFDAMLQREPLTQLKRVEIENIVQEYQDEIDRQGFKKNTATAAAH